MKKIPAIYMEEFLKSKFKIDQVATDDITQQIDWCYSNLGQIKFEKHYDSNYVFNKDIGGSWCFFKGWYFDNEKDAMLFKLTWYE